MTNEASICYRAYSAMADDVEALSLVRECRELEQRYSSNFTTQILLAAETHDGSCIGSGSTSSWGVAVRPSPESRQGHRKLWDHGIHIVKGIKNLLRVIAYPDHATKKCSLCDTTELNLQCLPEHFISEHTNSEGNWETL